MQPAKLSMSGFTRGSLALLFLGLLAGLGLMLHAAHKIVDISGALDLAADAQGNIWLALDGSLVKLSATGEIEKQFNFDQLGIGIPTTIVPMADGNVWVGSLTHAQLVLFSPAGKPLAHAVPPAAVVPMACPFHAAYEPTSDRLIVADTCNHRLLAFNGEGEFIQASTDALDLKYPNGIVADGHGGLLLADTNRHVIKSVRPDLTATNASMPALPSDTLKRLEQPFTWPVWVSEAADGGMFVSWHDALLGPGTVMAYAANGDYLYELPLDANVEPQGLLARKDDVLVALKSGETYKLLHFDRYGVALGAFGSNALQAKLTAISNQAKHLQRMQRGGQALLLLCALGLLIAAFWLRGQQRQVSAMDAA